MFLIHPTDLQRRRARCKPAVDRLRALAWAPQTACNLCGAPESIVLAGADRYGFPIRTALCPRCGLVYLLDRWTPQGYHEFYGSGAYRSLSSAFKGTPSDVAGIEREQADYAARLIAALQGYVLPSRGGQLLDVGGSAGVVAREFAGHFGLRATVLDPAPEEVAAATANGLRGVVGTLEDYESPEKFDLILLCRSIEHLLDLRGALSKIRCLLRDGGLFYCDIVDFLESCRRYGPPQVISKADHCYWLLQETAPPIFRSLGFEIVSVNLSFQADVLGYLLRRCNPAPLRPLPESWVDRKVRWLREIESDWCEYGRSAYDLPDRLKRSGYRFTRTIRHAMSSFLS